MTKLKPCPFCGGEATTQKQIYRYAVGCSDDSCRGFNVFSPLYKDEDEAIEAWNRRVK